MTPLIRLAAKGLRAAGRRFRPAGDRRRPWLSMERLEGRALLASMTFEIETAQMGLDADKYSIYAMASNFLTDASRNWYMDESLTLVPGLPPGGRTPSFRVSHGDTITVPDNHIPGGRLYFFVIPVGGVSGVSVTSPSKGYSGSTAPVTFGDPPAGGVRATGYAMLTPASDAKLDSNMVGEIVITNPGRGYTSSPTVTIDPPGVVDTVTVTAGGSGFPNGAQSFLVTSSGSGQPSAPAFIDVAVSGGSVQIGPGSITNRGAGYTGTAPFDQTINIGAGTGGLATVTLVSAATASATIFETSTTAGPSFPQGEQPLGPPAFPYVYQYVEFTALGKTAGHVEQANTVDLQTVDGFTMPMTIRAGKANTNVADKQFGQPIETNPVNVTRQAIFDAYSAFMSQLGTVGNPYLDLPYTLTTGLIDGQLGGILSPDAFLTAQDAQGNYLNLRSSLQTTFDDVLAELFSSATGGASGVLSLEGVGAVPQNYKGHYQPAVEYTSSVGTPGNAAVAVKAGDGTPVRLPALVFTGMTDSSREFRIFSPLGLSRQLSSDGSPLRGTITDASGTSATVQLDHPLPHDVKNHWFVFGGTIPIVNGTNQSPISAFQITSISHDRTTVGIDYTDVNGGAPGVTNTPTGQTFLFGFSQLPFATSCLTAGQMVFGNSGVFADNTIQVINADDQAVLGNLEYQVVAALNRGVALSAGTFVQPKDAGNGHTSTTWFNQSKWYPAGKTQNMFSYFMHVGQINGVPIFFQPASPTTIHGTLGEAEMGSAYGFPFDEGQNPEVPSKFDGNIGGSGGYPTDMVVTFGPWGGTTVNPDPFVEAPDTFTVNAETGPLAWTHLGKPLDVIRNVPAAEEVIVTISASPTATLPGPRFTWAQAAGVTATLVTADSVVFLQGTRDAINAALAAAVTPLGFDYGQTPPTNAAINLTISGWRRVEGPWTPFDSAFSVVDNMAVYPLVVDVPTAPQEGTIDTAAPLDLPHEMFADLDPTAAIYHVAVFSMGSAGNGSGRFAYASQAAGPSVSTWNQSGPMADSDDSTPQSVSLFGTIAEINTYVRGTRGPGIVFTPTIAGESRIDVTLLRLAVSQTTGAWIVVASETKQMTVVVDGASG